MTTDISTRMVVALSGDKLNQQYKQMKEIDRLKKVISEQARLLTRALDGSGATRDEDLVWVPGGLENPLRALDCEPGSKEARRRVRVWRRVRRMAEELSPYAGRSVEARLREQGIVERYRVEERLEDLQSKVRALSAAYKRILQDCKEMISGYRSSVPARLSA